MPDHTVVLTAINWIKRPDALRRVSYVDPETNKRFRFLTNNFVLPALAHRPDLQVALASGTLLQNGSSSICRFKAFYGLERERIVKTQIWIAVPVPTCLLPVVRKRLRVWMRASTRFYRFSAYRFLK